MSSVYASKSSTFYLCAEHEAGLKSGAKTICLTLEKKAFLTFIKRSSWQPSLIVLSTYVSARSIVQKPHWLYIESIIMLDIFIEMSVEHAVIFNKKDLKLFSADA